MPLYLLPQTIVPDSSIALDSARTAKPGEALLKAAVVPSPQLVLDGTFQGRIDRFKVSLPAGQRLAAMMAPPQSRALIGSDAAVFCGEEMETRSKAMNILVGNWFSKFDKAVRFCFVDSDADSKLDRVFLAGAFNKDLQTGQAIEPIAYHVEAFEPDAMSESIWIRYDGFRNGKIAMKIEFHSGDITYSASGIDTPVRYGANAYPLSYRLDTGKNALPANVEDVIGARLLVDKVGSGGELTYRVIANFPRTPFSQYTIEYRPFFIYY